MDKGEYRGLQVNNVRVCKWIGVEYRGVQVGRGGNSGLQVDRSG